MSKIAFVFPGQGSQQIGMGIDVAEKYPAAAKVFETADKALGISLSGLVKNGPEEELKQTVNTQPAVVAASLAMMEALRGEGGFDCQVTAGHSVGEYAALYCAGVLSLEDTLALTRARGQYMNDAGTRHPGTMSAIIGLDRDKLEEVCRQASNGGEVAVVANLNCPGQLVISGSLKGVAEAGRLAQEAGAGKVVPLQVSAAFHSPLMDEAAAELAKKLDTVSFKKGRIPVYNNVTGEPVTDPEQIRSLLKKQITSQVRWEESIARMIADGVDIFVEIGPGKALAGMIKKINRQAVIHNVGDVASLEKLLEKIKGDLVKS